MDLAEHVRTVGLMVRRRLVGLLGLGLSPDAKDVEIAVLRRHLAAASARFGRAAQGVSPGAPAGSARVVAPKATLD